MRLPALAVILLLVASASADDRFERAWRRANFIPEDVSCLIRSWPDGRAVLTRWDTPWGPVAIGSLLKPFLLLASASRQGEGFPRLACGGSKDGCWLPQGHGEIGAEAALALSCNVWFSQLAERTDASLLITIADRFSLPPPPPAAPKDAWWGRGAEWKLPPEAVLRAYAELPRRRGEPGVATVLAGLRRAGSDGTAAALAKTLQSRALAKTGTAPCSHDRPERASDGDGWTVALYPAERPRYAVLVRVHGVVGRRAAAAAAAALRALEAVN